MGVVTMRASLVSLSRGLCLAALTLWLGGCGQTADDAADTSVAASPGSEAAAPADVAPVDAAPSEGKTIANLQAAYQGESNAATKYTAFAAKADEEGYARVAQLFRAAAKAEEVHAGNHAKVIEALGQTPQATIETPEVGSTAENLQQAIDGETYEKETMYPDFLKAATDEGQADAVRSFNFALTAEAEHARLYQSALDDLANWKAAGAPFNVCTVCGWTCEKVDFEKCPSCLEPKSNYVEVS